MEICVFDKHGKHTILSGRAKGEGSAHLSGGKVNVFYFMCRLAWDLAVDTCMSQIDGVVNQGKTFQVIFVACVVYVCFRVGVLL